MEFSIANETKRQIVEQALNMAESDLYRELLVAGVEPESFTSVEDVDTNVYPDFVVHGPRINSLVNRISHLKAKLES